MLKQQDMTETAAAVLHFLPADKWVTPRMMTRTTGVSEARCHLILTQLVLAGLAKDNGGDGEKIQTLPVMAVSCCENGRLVGVGSTCQPFAHAYWSQANHGPLL
ncbi:hypothetical protein AD21_0332 [Escherichia coli 6-319-05_S4_C2]|nr:hypothetical protein AD21_0332 [Escherichia coli 6-319-05_S4_C2]